MQKLISIEWLKIKRYRTFWVLIALFAAILPIWNYEIARGIINFGGGKGSMNLLSTAYSFPQVWGNMGFWGSIFIMFLSILVIILTTNEYTFRTNRQNVIDGWSRLDFYHGKIIMVVSISILATLFVFILGALFGYANSGSFSGIFTEFNQVLYFLLLSLDYLGFALIIALLIKRSGLAIGLFIFYTLILENILKALINHYSTKPIGNLLPLQASDELLPFPMLQMAKNLISMGPVIPMTTYACVAAGWCAVYYFAGRLILSKNDW